MISLPFLRFAAPLLLGCLLAAARLPAQDAASLVASGAARQAFTYQIGNPKKASVFDAEGLPDGLVVNKTTGLITGTPTTPGVYTVTLVYGSDSAVQTPTLQLTIFVNPIATVTITPETDATISGGKVTAGSFLVTRTGGDLVDEFKVGYTARGSAVAGADYAATKGLVTFRQGHLTKHVKIVPLAQTDATGAPATVKLTLEGGLGYMVGAASSAKLHVTNTP